MHVLPKQSAKSEDNVSLKHADFRALVSNNNMVVPKSVPKRRATFRTGLHLGTCLGLRLGQATFRARATFRCRTRVRLARSN